MRADKKFREMFEKVKSMGHNWTNASKCNIETCKMCQVRKKHEMNLLKKVKIEDILIVSTEGRDICGKVIQITAIKNEQRKAQIYYKTWMNTTLIQNREKWFTLTLRNFENITSIQK